jgi:hypothetical protein
MVGGGISAVKGALTSERHRSFDGGVEDSAPDICIALLPAWCWTLSLTAAYSTTKSIAGPPPPRRGTAAGRARLTQAGGGSDSRWMTARSR